MILRSNRILFLRKKWLLCILAFLFFVGCGNRTGGKSVECYITEEQAMDEVGTMTHQVAIANSLIDEKCQTEGGFFLEKYYCSVTDLNSNGRLEIIIAYCGGSGLYTYFSIYEIDEKYERAIQIYEFNGEDMYERAPDIIKSKWEGIYDEEQELYYYYISDLLRDGAIVSHDDLIELSFGDIFEWRSVYCVENQSDSEGELVTTYYDSERNCISKSEYDLGIRELSRNYNITYYIKWIRINELGTRGMDAENQLLELYQSQRLDIK